MRKKKPRQLRRENEVRAANLNVRAAKDQYALWTRAAHHSGRSLSSWAADCLDEHAGSHPRLMKHLEQVVPIRSGRVPVRELRDTAYRRWQWKADELYNALLYLEDIGFITLHEAEESWLEDPLERQIGLRNQASKVISFVGLPIGRRPRSNIHLP